MIGFLTHEMKYRTAEGLKLPSIRAKHGLILMASPRTGLYIQTQLCECVKSPDNPFYDAKAAAQKALSFLLSPDVIPYDLSCMLQDRGMLPGCDAEQLERRRVRTEILTTKRALSDRLFLPPLSGERL